MKTQELYHGDAIRVKYGGVPPIFGNFGCAVVAAQAYAERGSDGWYGVAICAFGHGVSTGTVGGPHERKRDAVAEARERMLADDWRQSMSEAAWDAISAAARRAGLSTITLDEED